MKTNSTQRQYCHYIDEIDKRAKEFASKKQISVFCVHRRTALYYLNNTDGIGEIEKDRILTYYGYK